MSVHFKHRGSFKHTENFFRRMKDRKIADILRPYAEQGVAALASVTPVDTGRTAASWGYEITETNGVYSIHWLNTNVQSGVNIALILQYGHATGTGGYVTGIDYINPAIRPIFEEMPEKIWKEVTKP
jgi:hypothetical protein